MVKNEDKFLKFVENHNQSPDKKIIDPKFKFES